MTTMPDSTAHDSEHAFRDGLSYPAGVILCTQGEPIREVFHLQRGFVKLTRLFDNGAERIVGLRGHGWYAGAAGAILGQPATATVVTVTASTVSRLQACSFLKLLQSDAALSWRIHRMQSEEIDADLIQGGDWKAVRARDRLLSFLRSLPPVGEGTVDARRVVLPLRQWEAAQLLGMTAPYLCRLIRELESDGTLHRRGAVYLLPRENGTIFRNGNERISAVK